MIGFLNHTEQVVEVVGMHKMQRTFIKCTEHVPYPLVVQEIFTTLVPVTMAGDLTLFGTIAFLLMRGTAQSPELYFLMAMAAFTAALRSMKIWLFLSTNTRVQVPPDVMARFSNRQ